MPIHLHFQDDGGVIYKGTGIIEAGDIFTLEEQLFSSDESIKKIQYQIIDLTEVTDFKITRSEMETLAYQDNISMKANPNMRIAIVATEALTFGMNRIYMAHIDEEHENKVEVFKNLLQAKIWIDDQIKNI